MHRESQRLHTRIVRRFLIFGTGVILSACSSGEPMSAADAEWSAALSQVEDAIELSMDYPPGSVEVLASPIRVHISISDSKIAHADQAARERAADAVVRAAEPLMLSNALFSSVKEISVAIVHPESVFASHTEDVLEFQRGPDQRFSLHIL